MANPSKQDSIKINYQILKLLFNNGPKHLSIQMMINKLFMVSKLLFPNPFSKTFFNHIINKLIFNSVKSKKLISNSKKYIIKLYFKHLIKVLISLDHISVLGALHMSGVVRKNL